MALSRRRAKPLAELERFLSAAVAVAEQADADLAEAEQAHEQLDGTDPEAWQAAEAKVAAARSEAERARRAVASLHERCADAAERAARQAEEAIEAEAKQLDARIGEHEQALAKLRTQRGAVERRLEDAREEVTAARLAWLDPSSAEAKAARQRKVQHRETVEWHAKHPARDGDLSRRTLAEVRELRERRTREAQEANRRTIEGFRKAGMLLVDDDGNTVGGPLQRIERIERLPG